MQQRYRRVTRPVCFTILIVLVSMALTAPVRAQDGEIADVPSVVITGIGLIGGFPTGEFGKNVTNPGIGISGYVGYIPPRAPVVIGLDLGYLIYGHERRTEQFSRTIPDVLVGVATENNVFSMNAFLRLQTRDGPLRFYAEGSVGFHYLFTSTTIEDLPQFSGEEIASSTNLDDFAFAKGVAGGVLIEVWNGRDTRTPENRSVRSVSIELRIRYQDGSAADYLKRGDIVRRDGVAELNITQSTTDLITAHLGLAVDF